MTASSITYYDIVSLRALVPPASPQEPDLTVQIVPWHESDAENGRISSEAPLGRALLRRSCGETIVIQVGERRISMRILSFTRPGIADHDAAHGAGSTIPGWPGERVE